MIEILRENIIFKTLTGEEIENLLKQIEYKGKIYKKGENVAFRGDEVKGLKIILEGSLSAEMITREGDVRKIEELGVGEVLASAFIFGANNKFPVDLIASKDTKIFIIERNNFLKLLTMEKRILNNFLNEISNKTQLLSSKIWNNHNNKTISEKINDYIRNREINGEVFIENLKGIAESFGVTRPSLSRVLGEYVRLAKLERLSRNRYRIVDRDFFEI